ncbi:MAG: thiolase family protein [Acidobacteria bacterium]|nr:thiolase family protein [Acidobacteriota bacterium]MCG3190948.1 Acetyl-CoA acetyltransferase [Thermoanaerobaculia bacterium]
MSRAAFIVNGARTPFLKAGTEFKEVSAVDLGRAASVEALARAGVEAAEVDQVVFGNIATPVDAANIARVIALRTGVPKDRTAFSVSRNCASGIESIVQGARLIQTGEADVVLAGGAESMSLIPFLYSEPVKQALTQVGMARSPADKLLAFSKVPWTELLDPVIGLKQGLTDPVCDLNMGETAEILAKENKLSREMQDRFALRSHQRATAAREKLAGEIVPVPIPPKFDSLASADNGIRENQSFDALSKLKPFFDRKYGSVTAGNSSQITDGGAAVVLVSEEFLSKRKLRPIGRVVSWGFGGLEPERMGLGPARSTPVALRRGGLKVKDLGLIEMNEAFAAQVLANLVAFKNDPELGPIDEEILNVNGGAIALGHPVGSSGTRLVLTLLMEMRRRKVAKGLATLCIGGGQGASIIVEAA